jgi:alanine dehydrogenase
VTTRETDVVDTGDAVSDPKAVQPATSERCPERPFSDEVAEVLLLNAAEIESLLDLDALVDAVASAFVDLSSGAASLPQRQVTSITGRHGMLFSMPTYLPSTRAWITKVATVFPENRSRPAVQAWIWVFDVETGEPMALLDGTYITAVRTAAGSALATRLLARDDARTVSVIGTGVQACAHVRALARMPRTAVIRVAGRDTAKANAIAQTLTSELDRPIDFVASIEEAVRTADIVCAATHADQPVVRLEWLAPGSHVNSVGHNPSGQGEVEATVFRDALVVVESVAAALAAPPSGATEISFALQQGLITPDDIATEIGQLVGGNAPGRTYETQLTLYKSVGVAVEDAAAVALVLDAAKERRIGTQVSL